MKFKFVLWMSYVAFGISGVAGIITEWQSPVVGAWLLVGCAELVIWWVAQVVARRFERDVAATTGDEDEGGHDRYW